MRNLIYLLFIFTVALLAPRLYAQTTSNSDFNPFPQMEQDFNNTNEQTVAPDVQQNDDWPPASSNAQVINEDHND